MSQLDIVKQNCVERIYPQIAVKLRWRKFAVSEKQICAGEINDNFIALMKFQIVRARDFYRQGEQGITLLEKDSRLTVLLAARIYARILDEIERQNYDVFRQRAHTTFSQKLRMIPSIWREAKKI